MKIVKLALDDRLYTKIKDFGWTYTELLAIGIRAKQMITAAQPQKEPTQKPINNYTKEPEEVI
jgi:hypothetical protein